jgi:hypothetical protein
LRRKKKNKVSGPPTATLIGTMQSDIGTLHWGPFGDIDEMIAFCEHHGLQLTVIPLVDPSENPWEYLKDE